MYYKTVLIADRTPQPGKYVTCIDIAGEQRVYRLTESGWNIRDADGFNSPDTNLPLVSWLEEVSGSEEKLFKASADLLKASEEALKMYNEINPVGGWQGVQEGLMYAIKKAKP